jgi:membrane fusion protein (multidrug efflux system)
VIVAVCLVGGPWVRRSLNTVSTDDAYVNGHVTFVAPRVPGQVSRVSVDDNNRVRKGDLLVQLDKEPYQVKVEIASSGVEAAKADLVVAQAQARATAGQIRSMRFNLDHAIEDVNNQIALLRSRVAGLESQKAILAKTQADFDRARPLVESGAVSTEELGRREQDLRVAESQVEAARQGVYQIRVALGLPPRPEKGEDLTQVPEDLPQRFSSVRQAQASLIQAASQLGVVDSFSKTPEQMIGDFYKRDPSGDIDKIYEQLLKDAPAVKQAESKLAQAERALDQARLDLKYCDVVAEIDGVVTRRSVNPGDNLVAGQSVLTLRSLSEIWVDANFKETQLASLRIGQLVDLDVDMYGSRERFKGRISGFTMGTGSTLALLPAQNATGNFVKVVQRLPVRIDLIDYDPDKTPLFIGLSVTPVVRTNEPANGPNAGKVLQPYAAGPMPAGEAAGSAMKAAESKP